MIGADEVLERFRLLTGLAEAEAAPLLPLARGCAARLTARLRPGVDAQAQEARELLAGAAAGLLAFQHAALEGAGGLEGFRLGDFAVTASGQGAGMKQARALRDELLGAAAHLLLPESGFLMQVPPAGAEGAGA